MLLMRRIAKVVFRHRCKDLTNVAQAFDAWEGLPLELSANVHPLIGIKPIASLPLNLETNFYPGETKELTLSSRTIRLDVLGSDEPNLTQAAEAIASCQGCDEARAFQMVWCWFIQAGHNLLERRSYRLALRAFLNARRLVPESEEITPEDRLNIARCLLAIGDSSNSGNEYVLCAEGFLESGKSEEAAEAFEKAALAWEAMQLVNRSKPTSRTPTSRPGTRLCPNSHVTFCREPG